MHAAAMKRMPSLDSLRAFEAAARHLSFTKAAAELHVTPSALSHRVNAVEEELGVKLFHRLTRRLELTPEGETLAQGMRRGLDEITRALAALDRDRASGPLVVSLLPSFATRWFVPRLSRFRARHPQIEVRVDAEPALVDLRAGDADLAIRFGRGEYPGLHVSKLMGDSVFPVCSPQLLAEVGAITQPEQITTFPLLHDAAAEKDGSGADWASWLRHVGTPDVPAREGTRLTHAILTIEAAINGLGLALARRTLVADDLAAGRLVRVLPHESPTLFSYYLVCLPESLDRWHVKALRDWVLDEVAAATGAVFE